MTNIMEPTRLRSLYRQLLQEAKKFPSVKRAAIYQDIRLEWRDNVHLSDPKKIRNAIEVAVRGLDTMKKYTSLNKRSSSWSITLEQDPLGIGKQQQEQEEQQRLAQQQQQQSITTSSTTTTTKLNNNKSEEFEILNNNVHKLE